MKGKLYMKILFYDLETTGLHPETASIIQLAGIMTEFTENNEIKPLGGFNYTMKPRVGREIDLAALEINGFTMEELATFQDDKEVFEKFTKFLDKHIDQFNKVDKAILAGYNNTHFDTDFLRQWFIDNNNNYFGSYFWSNSIDVMPEASRYFIHYRPALLNFKLGTVAKALGIEIDKSSLHDGLYDIKLTLLMFKKLLNEQYIKPFDPEEAERMYMQMLQDKKNTSFTKKKAEGKITWS